MVVTFCGHSRFEGCEEIEQKVLSFLEEKIGNNAAEAYLGGYGQFDAFAYACCKKYQKAHKKFSLVFVTPYLTEAYQKNYLCDYEKKYDSIVYPPLEEKPLKLAIIYRNRYMVDEANYVIAYVTHKFGGAYATYQYAKRKKKEIYNVAPFL